MSRSNRSQKHNRSLGPGSEVWAYLRVSGDEQADRGTPILGQRQAIEAYCAQHGYFLARIYTDEAISGSSDDRPQFQLMMADAAASNSHGPAAIVLWAWSRFARNQNDAMFWKASLRRQGIEIVTIEDDIPRVDGFETIIESLIHWKDEQKLHEISVQSKRGQQTLARMGYIPAGGPAPRGYKVVIETGEVGGKVRHLRRWVPDPEIWPVVRRAWEMRLAGASYHQIIRETRLYKSAACLNTFFMNSVYKGEAHFGDTTIPIEPVVTAEEWELVQQNRMYRGGSHARQIVSQFLLSGLLKCGRCGSMLSGGHTPDRVRRDGYRRQAWRYYQCTKRHNQKACDMPQIKAVAVEQAIVDFLFEQVFTPQALAYYQEQIEAKISAERPDIQARLELLRNELWDVEGRIQRLLDALEDGRSVSDRLALRETEAAALRQEIAALEYQVSGMRPATTADVDGLADELRAALAEGPVAEARALVASVISEIIVEDGAVLRVRWRLPFGVST